MKQQTVPRLELCGAQLLSKLLSQVATDRDVHMESVYAWTDSAVVLGWLKTSPSRLKVYASHRVANILRKIHVHHWRYIDTNHNPTDLASRGIALKGLIDSKLWWSGSPWLSLPPGEWPRRLDIDRDTVLSEMKPVICVTTPVPEEYGMRFSSFSRMCRVTAWILRFLHRTQTKKKESVTDFLAAEELNSARAVLLKVSQYHTYSHVLSVLQQKKPLAAEHPCSSLAPFIDSQDLLWVGGRLHKAGLPTTSTHPIILSSASHIAQLLMSDSHRQSVHAGTSTVLARLSNEHYITGAKKFLKKLSRTCVKCQTAYARTSQQLMGDLPASRIRAARPFSKSGLDLHSQGGISPETLAEESLCMCIHMFFHKSCLL